MAGKETELVKAALNYLKARGIFAWRNNTGAVQATYKGKVRYTRFGMPGLPDILGCLPGGQLLAAEAKIGRGELSLAQDAVLNELHRVGACTIVFYSLEELIEQLPA